MNIQIEMPRQQPKVLVWSSSISWAGDTALRITSTEVVPKVLPVGWNYPGKLG